MDAFRLQETSWDKKGFMGYVKGFMKKVADKLTPERKEKFMAEAPAAVKMLLGKFDELQFFMGETGDMEASLCYAYYKDGCAWRRVNICFQQQLTSPLPTARSIRAHFPVLQGCP